MSKAIRHVRYMRIIALPLTTGSPSTSRSNVYYRFQTPPPPTSSAPPSLLKKAINKTAEIWSGFGKAPERSWKQRMFLLGERIMDRIEFEELALKSMDPSLGPDLSQWRRSKSKSDEKSKEENCIPIVHPVKLAPFDKISPVDHLRTLLSRRTPRHKQGFYVWMVVAPLMAPFALVPIIPNLPFFFCVWRSWHHYRAYKASAYLESLMERGAIMPEPNMALDAIYEENKPEGEDTVTGESHNPEHVVLSKEAVPKIVNLFELPPAAAADLLRALDQTYTRLKKESSQQ